MNQSGVRENGKLYANMLFYNGGMGGQYPHRRFVVSVVAVERVVDLDRDLRAHHAVAISSQAAASRQRRRWTAPRRIRARRFCMESLSDTPVAVSFLAERTVFPAFGIEGGQAGAPGDRCGSTASASTRSGNICSVRRHRPAGDPGRRRPRRSAPTQRRGGRVRCARSLRVEKRIRQRLSSRRVDWIDQDRARPFRVPLLLPVQLHVR